MNTAGQVTVRQWFRLPKAERQRRVTEFKAADAALQAYRPPDGEEDETYLEFNGRVDDLWPAVPWWIRNPALPHPGTRRGAALYAVAAAVALAVAMTLALVLSGCDFPACHSHGGIKWTNGKVYECNDGTWE